MLAVLATLTMLLGNMPGPGPKEHQTPAGLFVHCPGRLYLDWCGGRLEPGIISGAIYYLMFYLVTNLAAFGVVAMVGKATGSDEISAYAGLSRRAPGLALILLVALLSLGGIPPFGGFAAKIFVFAAAIEKNLMWLAVVGIINSIIGLYYYLIVLKTAYLYRSENEAQPLKLSRPWSLALGLCVVGILLIGTVFAPWFNWASHAAASLF